jgi:xanthine dehydrogenase YagS FAD-binding subunit
MRIATAAAQSAEFRAGATDLSERRRSGLSREPMIDIAVTPDIVGTSWGADGAATIGTLVTIAEIAADGRLRAAYPGLTVAAGNLATPQIRRLATLA